MYNEAPMRQAEMILERILSWDKERGWVGGVSTTHYDLWTTHELPAKAASLISCLTIFLALGQC